MVIDIVCYIKNITENLKNRRIDYYVDAFRRFGMFDDKQNAQIRKETPVPDTKIILAENESAENAAQSSPFWNSEVAKEQPHSDKICDILRPHPLGNHIWNWAAFFFGPFWAMSRCGFSFIVDFLFFIILALPACAAIKIGSGEISFLTRFCMLALFFIYMILHGYFGNYVYGFTVKRDVEIGFHIITRYFSALNWVDSKQYNQYFRILSNRAKNRHPQRLIINEKNVRHYLKTCTYMDTEHLKLTAALFPVWFWLLSIFKRRR